LFYITRQPALIPLAGPANRQGRIAADNVCGRDSVYKETQGTSICKVFNMAIGMTGLSEKSAKRAGIKYEKVYVHPSNHAGYYPGAHPISFKLLFDPESGKVLGAQAVGAEGVDKRIDVIATAIRAEMTVEDLSELELSYAPPFGSAKDVVNYAGFVANNVVTGEVKICHADEIINPKAHRKLIDVRNSEEVAMGTIHGAKNIPLPELRNNLDKFSKEKEYLIFCQVGMRGYIACRLLQQHGIKCRNLSGGYKTYTMTVGKQLVAVPEKEVQKTDTGEKPARLRLPEERLPKIEIDACGLQCPGPIMKLKGALEKLSHGETLAITSTDPGFAGDIPAWCNSTGNLLEELGAVKGGGYRAVITKGAGGSTVLVQGAETKRFTNVVFSNDLDKALAAFIIANGAATMGYEVTLFFTFWGINILRKDNPGKIKKNLIEKMFGMMMPKGPNKLGLSQMNMGGIGKAMIEGIMDKKNVATLPELIESAKAGGVKLVVCSMSMDLMGIKREELIDGIEEGGVAMYIDKIGGNANLFI